MSLIPALKKQRQVEPEFQDSQTTHSEILSPVTKEYSGLKQCYAWNQNFVVTVFNFFLFVFLLINFEIESQCVAQADLNLKSSCLCLIAGKAF